MKRSSIAIAMLFSTLGLASVAMAQAENPGGGQSTTLGTVVSGNTTTVFKSAGNHNIDAARLRTWNDFAEGHPKIAKSLAYNSSLINDHSYLSKHPSLDSFFVAHPDIKEAMVENPGNFVAIPPRPGE